MSKPTPARYRTTNWPSYTAALRKRGSLLVWLDKAVTWLAPYDGSPSRPAVFSDAAIQFCLTIKVLFKLPLRHTTGMVASLLKMAGLDWAVPDYTTLCRRQKTLAVQIPYRRADGPLNLLLTAQASRSSVTASGKPASMGRRVDANGARCIWPWTPRRPTSGRASLPPSSEGDSPVLPGLLDQIPEGEEIGTVTADGAYDTRRCHTTIIDRQATAIIPIRKNGRPDHALCGPLMGLMDTAARVGFEGTFTAADILDKLKQVQDLAPSRLTGLVSDMVEAVRSGLTDPVVSNSRPSRAAGKLLTLFLTD